MSYRLGVALALAGVASLACAQGPQINATTTAAVAPPAAELPAPLRRPMVTEVWTINTSDGTLRNALVRLATAAGWQLSWELESDIAISATAQVEGNFEGLIAAVAEATGVQFRIYRGNRVVVARDREKNP